MAEATGGDVLVVVYAVHDFDAENPDELSFKAGERILVTEKDDQYQDGWWQVRTNDRIPHLEVFSHRRCARRAATPRANRVSFPRRTPSQRL